MPWARARHGAVDREARLRLGQRLHGTAHPRVTEARGTVDGRVGDPRHPQRRTGPLHRARMHRELGELPEAAVVGGVLLAPHQAEDLQRLFHPGAALAEVGAVHLVLERPPAETRHPSETRPFESWSMVATCSATRIGLCTGSWKMPVPTRSVVVRTATAVRNVSGSLMFPGMKW